MPKHVHIIGYVEGGVPGEEVYRVVRSHFFPTVESLSEISNLDLLSCLHQTEEYIKQDGHDPDKCILVAVIDEAGNDLLSDSRHSIYMQDAINLLKEGMNNETK